MNSSDEYDPDAFPRVAVTVDIVIFTIQEEELQVVLIKRGEEPFLGRWALPGGFLQPDEDLDAAAVRELAEETGIVGEADIPEQFGAYSSPGRDPRMRVVTVAYWAICSDLPEPVGGGDADEARLVPVSMIETGEIELAFDHCDIVSDAVKHAVNRLESSPLVAVNFCKEEQFTISELRNVYEAVWNESIDPGNFQRKVRASKMFRNVSAAKISEGPRGGRPASLWSLNEMGTAQIMGASGDAEPEEGTVRKRKTRGKLSRKKTR